MTLESILKFIFGVPLPKVNDSVRIRATGETALVVKVSRDGAGFFETYATCTLRLQTGKEVKLLETEFEK